MPFRRSRTDREADLDVIDLRERLAPHVQDIDLVTGRARADVEEQDTTSSAEPRIRGPVRPSTVAP